MAELSSNLANRMTRRYVIALCLVALVSTAALIAFLHRVNDEEKRATVISLTSGQRALSQRIAFSPMPMPTQRMTSISRTTIMTWDGRSER